MDTSLTALAIVGAVAAITILATRHIKERIMSAEQNIVDTITAQLTKAKGEIVAKIDELANAHPDVDFSALQDIAQQLDDIVPDPAPEPVAEQPATED